MKTSLLGLCLAAATSAMAGCGGSQVEPESAAGHEARAAHHEQAAEAHGTAAAELHHIEWSDAQRKDHLEQAAKHREIAAKHRERSEALRAAEARACEGLEADDRDEGPFVHKDDIVAVETIMAPEGKQRTLRKRGARVTFRPVPGMTAEWMQRLIGCRLATAEAMNYEVEWLPDDPLGVKGITAGATTSGVNFVVEIRANDMNTTDEVLRRINVVSGKTP